MEERNKEEDEGVKDEMQKVTSKERPTLERFRGSARSQQEQAEKKSKMDPPPFSSVRAELFADLTVFRFRAEAE